MAERHWPIINSNPVQDQLGDRLDELLNEVCAFAIRLKQDARRVQSSGTLPGGGHNVLGMLRRFGALTVPQMARLDFTSRQNIQTVVNRLVKEGCIESAPNPGHKRSGLLRLTDRGLAASDIVSRNTKQYKEKLLPDLSEADLTRTTQLLRIMRERICAEVAPGAQNEPNDVSAAQRLKKSKDAEGLPLNANATRLGGVQIPYTLTEENELPVSLL